MLALLLLPACAQDDPVDPFDAEMSQVDAQGQPAPPTHHYFVLGTSSVGFTWEEAKVNAEAQLGVHSHLATITSAAENAAIVAAIAASTWAGQPCWIGLYQRPSGKEPAGGWKWLAHERLTYTNWNSGEPNNGPNGNEDFASILATGYWNDLSAAHTLTCWIGERDY
jgi:hypothetical protein